MRPVKQKKWKESGFGAEEIRRSRRIQFRFWKKPVSESIKFTRQLANCPNCSWMMTCPWRVGQGYCTMFCPTGCVLTLMEEPVKGCSVKRKRGLREWAMSCHLPRYREKVRACHASA